MRRPDPVSDLGPLARDVAEGLDRRPKRLPSRYFYDEEGSRLFEQIMALPEYYLTRAEARLLAEQGDALARRLADGARGVELVEMGSGNGAKTLLLCRALHALGVPWSYRPIDLSPAALGQLRQRFEHEWPGADVRPLVGDYARLWPSAAAAGWRQVALLMGSNLGNLDHDEAVALLALVRQRLRDDDRLLLGLDLQKDPAKILRAYDDAHGVTARFNLNLLSRLNRELEMDFDAGRFRHFASYCPLDGAARSFLVSTSRQVVYSRVLRREFAFDEGESIYVEQSQKYSESLIDALLHRAGLQRDATLVDEPDCYAVVVARAAPRR